MENKFETLGQTSVFLMNRKYLEIAIKRFTGREGKSESIVITEYHTTPKGKKYHYSLKGGTKRVRQIVLPNNVEVLSEFINKFNECCLRKQQKK